MEIVYKGRDLFVLINELFIKSFLVINLNVDEV